MKLTDEDLKAIGNLIRVILDEELDAKFDEKLSHLPTKDELYGETTKIYNFI